MKLIRGVELTEQFENFQWYRADVSESNMVTVNSRLAEQDEPLTDGASVLVLPFVGGG